MQNQHMYARWGLNQRSRARLTSLVLLDGLTRPIRAHIRSHSHFFFYWIYVCDILRWVEAPPVPGVRENVTSSYSVLTSTTTTSTVRGVEERSHHKFAGGYRTKPQCSFSVSSSLMR
jgi:hypothetical protein